MSTKVLVFESDAAFAADLRNELTKLGCATSVVEDGNAGLQAAAAEKPDLILLSIELPRMNGFSVCNKLKKDSKLKDVPLIIMSTESSEETFEQHRKLRTRAEAYVHKPIAFGDLLGHIQQFVKLEVPEAQNTDGDGEGIVIDDEISSIDIEEEGTLVVERAAPPGPPPPAPRAPPKGVRADGRMPSDAPAKLKQVDEDIEAFIEGGFGKLTQSPANGAPAAEAPTGKKSAAPPAGEEEQEVAPAPKQDDGRIAALEKELEAAREDAARLRADFDARMEAEQLKMDTEMQELRSKLATTATKGGVSSREFLDLREALNKKDKEILALKEQLGKKDKEIVETRDKTLAFERAKADIEDKMLASLREIEEQKEKLDALARDKDQAKKAGDDFRARLTKVEAELEGKASELEQTKARAASLQADLERRNQELEEERVRVAEQGEGHAAALAAAKAEHESVLAVERATKAQDIEAAQQRASAERAQAIAEREQELKAEADSRLAALHRAHQEELGNARTEHAREQEALAAKHASELAAAQSKHEEQLEQATSAANERMGGREAELEARRVADLEKAERRRMEEIATFERDRDQKVAAAQRERDEQVAAAQRERDERVAAVEGVANERVTAIARERDEAVSGLQASTGSPRPSAASQSTAPSSSRCASSSSATSRPPRTASWSSTRRPPRYARSSRRRRRPTPARALARRRRLRNGKRTARPSSGRKMLSRSCFRRSKTPKAVPSPN